MGLAQPPEQQQRRSSQAVAQATPTTPGSKTQPVCSRRGLWPNLWGLSCGLAGLGLAARAGADAAAGLCGHAAPPAYPAPDKPALVQSWLQDGHRDGPVPDCGVLQGRDFELVVRLTASFLGPADIDALLARLGAISALKGASYWSFTDRKRLPLFKDAFAVDAPGSQQPRPDFSASELRQGIELNFVHNDNRSSQLSPYGMRLVKASPDGLQLQVENLGELRMFGLLLVAPRETQWAVTIERLGPGRWGYRSLLAQRRLRLGRNEQHRLSNLARCVAMFDLLAGRQTEIESLR